MCVSLIPSHHKLAVMLPHTAHRDILLLHRSNPMEPANHWAEVYEMEPHRSFPVCHLCHSLAVIKKLTNTDFGFFFFSSKKSPVHGNTKEQSDILIYSCPQIYSLPGSNIWSPISHSLLYSGLGVLHSESVYKSEDMCLSLQTASHRIAWLPQICHQSCPCHHWPGQLLILFVVLFPSSYEVGSFLYTLLSFGPEQPYLICMYQSLFLYFLLKSFEVLTAVCKAVPNRHVQAQCGHAFSSLGWTPRCETTGPGGQRTFCFMKLGLMVPTFTSGHQS